MTSPLSAVLRSARRAAALATSLLAAACAEPASAPGVLRSEPTPPAFQGSGSQDADNNGHAKNDAPLDARLILDEATSLVRVDVTTGKFNTAMGELPPVPGSTIEKVRIELPSGSGCESEYKFTKLAPNNGKVTLQLPVGSCAQDGATAKVTVHVKGLKNGSGSDAVVLRVPVLSGDFSGVPGGQPGPFDVSVLPIKQVTADDPSLDIAVQPAQQAGSTTRYDVTVSNAASGIAAQVKCEVRLDGVDVTNTSQFWINGVGEQDTPLGATISLPSGTARICRFAITFAGIGPHTVIVAAIATGAAEPLDNNSTTMTVSATEFPPLKNYSWNLKQEDAVDSDGGSLGIRSQSGTIHMEWEEALGTESGTDTWSFTVRSSTNGAVFDERIGVSVSAARFTQSELTSGGQACRDLQPETTSATHGYLRSSIRVCAVYNAASPSRATMRLEYVVFSARYDPVPLPLSEGLLWGPTFSLFAKIEHVGVGTFGGTEETRTLSLSSLSGGIRTVRYIGP